MSKSALSRNPVVPFYETQPATKRRKPQTTDGPLSITRIDTAAPGVVSIYITYNTDPTLDCAIECASCDSFHVLSLYCTQKLNAFDTSTKVVVLAAKDEPVYIRLITRGAALRAI